MATTIYRGDTTFIDIAAKDINGLPFNLSNCSLWFTIKKSLKDADETALVRKTLTNGINIVNAAAGLATVVLVPADTANLSTPIMGAYWDVQLKDSFGNVFTIARGTASILVDVTRSST